MKQIPVTDLIPGMITAEAILSYDSHVIVPKGVVLTENIISRLESYSIYYVTINDQIFDELSEPMTESELNQNNPINYDALSNKQKIQVSPEFLQFSQDFHHCAQHFEQNLIGAIYKQQPLFANDLIAETKQLLQQGNSNVSIIDMLLNLRNIGDSTCVHCINVALISTILARWLHWSEKEENMVTYCGLFHDVGKYLLPHGILNKPEKLTSEEFEIIKTHTIEGFHLLSKYDSLPLPVKNTALMHHEKCDGSGYPYGLSGNEIDKYSKIVTIADIFDAMTCDRVYRKAMSPFSVIKSFEDDGIQKYELKYILTFLENIANSFLNHRVSLSNGLEGNVIFINKNDLSRPVIMTQEKQIINLQEQYFNNIMDLSSTANVSIETII